MLASEIIYAVLASTFADRVGPAPLPEPFDHQSGTYITYQKISGVGFEDDYGWLGHDEVRMQINVYHSDIIECEKESTKMRWLMNSQNLCACSEEGSSAGFDSETQLYFEQVDFLIWQSVC